MRPSEPSTARPGVALLLLFLLLGVGIVAAGALYYRSYERHFRAEVEKQLSAIADLKAGELVKYRQERLGDARLLFQNPSFTALVRRFFEQPADADALRQLQDRLGPYLAVADYEQVRLVDAQGVSRLTIPAGRPQPSAYILQRSREVLASKQVELQDFYRSGEDQRVYLAVLVPLLDARDARPPLGVLILRLDPEKFLYPFIKRWPVPSRSAETLLVRKDGNDALFLNELRFQTNTALNLRTPLDRVTMPAVQAALGREGLFDGIDYRGVPVLAALRTIPDSPWAMVARMDNAEVFGP